MKPLIRKTAGTITMMKRIISQVKRLIPSSKLVSVALPGDLIGELSEIGFRPGVGDHADAESADDAGAHEAEIRKLERVGRISPVTGAADFSDGMASPVSAAWLTKRSLALMRRRSAGIMSPADSRTTSPGTS